MRYVYDNHVGGIFLSDRLLSHDELYCNICLDCDRLLGEFETLSQFWDLIKDKCSIDGSGGYSLQYIFPIIVKEFNLDEELTYNNYDDECQGFCNISDEDIIKILLKECENG